MKEIKPLPLTHTECSVSIPALSAKVMGSGDLEVYATPAMAALMEKAAYKTVLPYLDENEATVGTMLSIEHLSATPMGMQVKATATLTEVNGRALKFTVEAHDETGLIGKGTHERFVVGAERFMQKTNAKSANPQ